MVTFISKKTDLIAISEDEKTLSDALKDKLYAFTQAHYVLDTHAVFEEKILKLTTQGLLIIFYDLNDEIIGYTRLYENSLHMRQRTLAIYSAQSYLSPAHDLTLMSIYEGLNHILNKKLMAPEIETLYFAMADTPQKYACFAELHPTLYPHPSKHPPEALPKFIEELIPLCGWALTSSVPYRVATPIKTKGNPAESTADNLNALHQFFNLKNPNATQGESLLIYIPLNIVNMGFALRQLTGHLQGDVNIKTALESFA